MSVYRFADFSLHLCMGFVEIVFLHDRTGEDYGTVDTIY